jgi:glycosyltransferase involved in cell wall biosynthesis
MSISHPKVSIIVPVYNVEKYLNKCISSLLAQTLSDIEIICVDDGSTDNSLKILKSYAEIDNRIRVISQENQGVSSARNNGFTAANGDYVYFIDSDDYLELNAMEILYSYAILEDLDILYFNGTAEYQNEYMKEKYSGYGQRFSRNHTYPGVVNGKEMFVAMYQNKDYRVNMALQFLKRNYVTNNSLNFIPGFVSEDVLFTFSAILNADRVSYKDKRFFHRLIRDDSITTNKNYGTDVITSWLICLVRMFQIVIGLDFSEEESAFVTTYLARFQNKAISSYLGLRNDEKKNIQKELTIPEKIIINSIL